MHMDSYKLLLTIPIGISLYIQSLFGSSINESKIDKPGLNPPVNMQIFNSPTPSPSPTLTPTPSPSPTSTPTPTPSPTPNPTPTPFPVTGTDLDRWFEQYAGTYSIDRMKLFSIAACESNLRPNAINGPYGGLYQFSTSAWISTRTVMNLDTNPDLRFSPEEAIKTAAFKISVSGSGAWPNCGK